MSQKNDEAKEKEVSLLVAYVYPNEGAKRSRKRVGRGPGSGWGKTSGKGSKGQKSRSGAKIHPRFEGGQMPLQRRLPKRGFHNIHRVDYQLVKMFKLNRFEDGSTVGLDEMLKAGLIKKKGLVKILSNGELTKSLIVSVHKVTGQARQKIEAAGGSVQLLD